MKLSIAQYNEIFKDRSITNYTKFNWKGDMPVIAKYTFDTGYRTVSYASLGLERGKKYIIEVVNREVGQLTGGKTDAGWSSVSFNNSGNTTYTGVEVIDTTDTVQYTDVYCYGNGFNYANSVGQPIKTTIVVKEYVENLVSDAYLWDSSMGTKTGDNYRFTTVDSYVGIIKTFPNSNLQYGDYRMNYFINESQISGNIIVYLKNNTTHNNITEISSVSSTSWIFSINEENYTPGDNLIFELYPSVSEPGKIIDIGNLYLCKIQDE